MEEYSYFVARFLALCPDAIVLQQGNQMVEAVLQYGVCV